MKTDSHILALMDLKSAIDSGLSALDAGPANATATIDGSIAQARDALLRINEDWARTAAAQLAGCGSARHKELESLKANLDRRYGEDFGNPDSHFKQDYLANKAEHSAHGTTEEMYIRSRRIDAGLDDCTPAVVTKLDVTEEDLLRTQRINEGLETCTPAAVKEKYPFA